MTTLQFLGAAGCVTGSRFMLETGSDRVLVDCGLFQGTKDLRLRNWSPFPVSPAGSMHVVLTHAHLDHSGYLPRLMKEGFRGTIFATPATVDLCGILLPDSGHIQEADARFANKKGFSRHKPALPLYTEVEAVETLQFLRPVPYGHIESISPRVSFSFQPAGHIFGSGFIRMTVDDAGDRMNVLFSGDLGRYGQPITHDPTPVESADYLLVESTYGDRLHEPSDAKEALAAIVRETSARGGVLLIPSFAVGRTQELLYILRELEGAGRIPTLPVYVDSPMAIDATRILMKYPEEHDLDMSQMQRAGVDPLNCREVNFVRSVELSKTLNGMRYPMVVIASSGMATGGRILHHLAHRLPDDRNTVLFVGYQSEGTPGRSLLEGARQLRIHGQMIDVRAEVKMLGQFSAHADYSEILRWLRNFTRAPRAVFIVHGEPGPRNALKEKIVREFEWKVILPEHLERFDLT